MVSNDEREREREIRSIANLNPVGYRFKSQLLESVSLSLSTAN